MIDTVHLLINRVCGHNCSLCCNKHYNIKKIPCITNKILSQVHTLCLTGGDPFFINFLLDELVMQIRKEFPNRIFMPTHLAFTCAVTFPTRKNLLLETTCLSTE